MIMNIRTIKNMLLFIFFIFLLLPFKADAYIDPNAGGFFFTSVLPFVYGILAAIVVFWKRIVNAAKNIFPTDTSHGNGRKKENDS